MIDDLEGVKLFVLVPYDEVLNMENVVSHKGKKWIIAWIKVI